MLTLVRRFPRTSAIILFIAVMTAVKLGAHTIVAAHGLTGALVTIGLILMIGYALDRRT